MTEITAMDYGWHADSWGCFSGVVLAKAMKRLLPGCDVHKYRTREEMVGLLEHWGVTVERVDAEWEAWSNEMEAELKKAWEPVTI